MEWYESIIALHASVTKCSVCRFHGERLNPQLQDRENAEEDIKIAWSQQQRETAHKKLLNAQWWVMAITRELQWHLVEDHNIIVKDPGWIKQPPTPDVDCSDNEETPSVVTFDQHSDETCVY